MPGTVAEKESYRPRNQYSRLGSKLTPEWFNCSRESDHVQVGTSWHTAHMIFFSFNFRKMCEMCNAYK